MGTKISELTAVTVPARTSYAAVVEGSTTKRMTVAQMAGLVVSTDLADFAAAVDARLTGYATTSALTTGLAAKADTSALSSYLTTATAASTYATASALAAGLAALNASNLTSGTVPDARFPATLPAASGVNLTALNASNLASGTIPDARFPATLPAASGANLTALNASNLASGTIPDARFPAVLPAVSGANLTNLPGGISGQTTGALPYASSATAIAASPLYREDANTIAQRNGTTAQRQNLYETYTDSSNYSRLALYYDTGNSLWWLTTEKAGTGTNRTLVINSGVGVVVQSAGATKLNIGSTITVAADMIPTTANLGSAGGEWVSVYGKTLIAKRQAVAASTGTTAITLSNGATVDVTLSSSTTFTFSGAVDGATYTFLLRQDATGSRTVTWPASVKWVGGTAPTLSTGASKVDCVAFLYDGTSFFELKRALDVR